MKAAQANKLPFKDQDLAKIRARREYSNPGTKSAAFAELTTEDLWAKLKEELAYLNDEQTTLQDLFTGPLCYDARFMYSHMLYEKLRNDNAWTALN